MKKFIYLFFITFLLVNPKVEAQIFSLEETPAWVKGVEIPETSKASKYDITSGYYLTLADYQINFEEDFKAVYLEDIWDITSDLRFTAGIRYDHYSNFGGHFSPRIGLTW